ncbi:MAG: 3-isopropylmalate dehydratase small subunit [Candidatus Heimdallarchaeaceae archaeon]
MSNEIIDGKARRVLVDDIDTDQIFHQSLLTIHDPEEIKPHIFGNLDGYRNFGKEDNTGKILIVGKNFGKGSTRQQAVTGFLAHKFKAIIGASFGPIYYSNAVNAGLLLVELPEIANFSIEENDELEIDITQSLLTNKTQGTNIKCEKIPIPVLDIMKAGGLMSLGDKI